MNQKYLALALLLILTTTAIPIASVRAAIPNPDTFKYATIGMAETGDPAWAYDTASGELIFNVYEPLLTFDGEKVDQYVPMIALSWPGSTQAGRNIIPSPPDPGRDLSLDTVDCDGDLIADPVVETWYFEINTAIPWQLPAYGTVTTADVEYTFERGMVMDPATTVQWMFFNPLLKCMSSADLGDLAIDANAQLMGRLIDNAIRSNSTHVWFNLRQGYAAFQQILSQTWACIVDKEWTIDPALDTGGQDNFPGFGVTGYIDWRDYNGPEDPGPLMDDPEGRMMGTGPYKLDYWDADPATGSYMLIKHAAYWGGWSPHPHVDKFYVEVVADWNARKAGFIAGDWDTVTVPRANAPELEGTAGIRYLTGLPTLAADALFFNADPNATSPYIPEQPIGTPAPTLFADRNTRLAFMYMMNKTLYAEEVYLGEATPIGNPIIDGIRYYNATKPYTDYNLAKAIHYFKCAYGGSDAAPGILWTQGFKVILAYNTANAGRKALCDIIAYNVQNDIPWPNPAAVSVVSQGVAWASYMAQVRANQLASYMVGWLVDFPDPHNWMIPFMHTQGDFARYQHVDYSTEPATLNWYGNTYGPLPYHNYKGDLVTGLNNTYVDGLINLGIGLPDSNPLRQKLYEELMDIFFAEGYTMMLVQAKGRHYERDWVNGWFYSPIRPGYYCYDIWKSETCTYDVASTMRVEGIYHDLYFDVHSYGTGWPIQFVYENVTIEIADWETYTIEPLNGAIIGKVTETSYVLPSGKSVKRIQVDVYAWVRYCHDTDVLHIWISCTNGLKMMEEEVRFYGPPPMRSGIGWVRALDMDEIPDATPANNEVHETFVIGDLNNDGVVNYKDGSIFRGAYVVAYNAIADYNNDGVVNYKDGSIFRATYVGSYS
jgi:peptide/nickel transport system substrate-binding protein